MALHIPWLFAILIASLAVGSALAQGKKPALTEQQRKQIQEVIAAFRKAKPKPEERLAVIDRMAAHGPIGLNQLLTIIEKELGKPLDDYRTAFAKAAAGEGMKKLDPEALAEIAKIRGDVLDLSKKEDLKKEDIVKVGDPGLERLRELILFSREDVLRKHPELNRRREPLQTLGKQWERCAIALLDAQAEEDEKKEREKAKREKEKSLEAKAKAQAGQPEEAEPIEPPSFEKYLAKEEELATALAMPMDPRTRTVLATNAAMSARLDPEEARCVLDLNLTRALLGLAPLEIDLALAAAARDHSTDMQDQDFFDHLSPIEGKKTPQNRAKRFGTSASGENIARGVVDGTAANHIWWHSPGHHKNMLGEHHRVGVGRAGRHWTELFGN